MATFLLKRVYETPHKNDGFRVLVDQAKTTNTWLVLVYHQVDPNATDKYNTYPSDFNAQLNVIKSSGVTVETVNQALDELISQL